MDLSHLLDLALRCGTDAGRGLAGLRGLSVYRREAVSPIEAVLYEPVLCLILQGAKVTAVGRHSVRLAAGDALLVSHDVPVTSRITRASAAEPYVALILNLDLDLVRSLHEVLAEIPPAEAPGGPLATTRADLAWGAPLARYLELAAAPLDARVLGPAVLREIHYRLLLTPIGARLRALLLAGSPASRIAKAIRRMRTGFRDPLAIPDLARTAGMSPSSFHQHFKAVTGTTPLRYRKELRLIEARGLLAGRGQSVSQAAFAVGYQSPTHFSRDYSRKFGRAPSLDGTAVA